MTLTEKGDKNYKEVIEVVYQYINQIRKEGPAEYLYEEHKQKALIDFNNITKGGALGYANYLSRRVNYWPNDEAMDNILFTPYALEDFDSEDIKSRLNLFVPENMYAYYHSKLLE